MKKKVKVTQEMVDWVESHREGDIRYDKNFHISIGEELEIVRFSTDDKKLIVLQKEDGSGFYIPESVVGVSIAEMLKEIKEERLQEELMEKHKEQLLNTDWTVLRNQAAIAAMQSYVSIASFTCPNREEEIAKLSVMQADALVKELQKC